MSKKRREKEKSQRILRWRHNQFKVINFSIFNVYDRIIHTTAEQNNFEQKGSKKIAS